MYQRITIPKPASIIIDPITSAVYAHYLHTLTPVQTMLFGEQTGEIVAVVPDPFGTAQMMCYVISMPWGQQWEEYLPIRSVKAWHLATCTDCGKLVDSRTEMHECGYCYGCCDCPTEHLDDLD